MHEQIFVKPGGRSKGRKQKEEGSEDGRKLKTESQVKKEKENLTEKNNNPKRKQPKLTRAITQVNGKIQNKNLRTQERRRGNIVQERKGGNRHARGRYLKTLQPKTIVETMGESG